MAHRCTYYLKDLLILEILCLRRHLSFKQAIAERLVREKDALEQSIQELNDNIKELEKQNEDMKENKKLLIMYPDLNGPVNPDISGMY